MDNLEELDLLLAAMVAACMRFATNYDKGDFYEAGEAMQEVQALRNDALITADRMRGETCGHNLPLGDEELCLAYMKIEPERAMPGDMMVRALNEEPLRLMIVETKRPLFKVVWPDGTADYMRTDDSRIIRIERLGFGPPGFDEEL